MGALNLPSAADIERLTRRLRSVSQRLEGIEDGVDRLDERLAALGRQAGLQDELAALGERLGRHRAQARAPAEACARAARRRPGRPAPGPAIEAAARDDRRGRSASLQGSLAVAPSPLPREQEASEGRRLRLGPARTAREALSRARPSRPSRPRRAPRARRAQALAERRGRILPSRRARARPRRTPARRRGGRRRPAGPRSPGRPRGAGGPPGRRARRARRLVEQVGGHHDALAARRAASAAASAGSPDRSGRAQRAPGPVLRQRRGRGDEGAGLRDGSSAARRADADGGSRRAGQLLEHDRRARPAHPRGLDRQRPRRRRRSPCSPTARGGGCTCAAHPAAPGRAPGRGRGRRAAARARRISAVGWRWTAGSTRPPGRIDSEASWPGPPDTSPKPAPSRAEAVRSAVDQAFHATADRAEVTGRRAQEIARRARRGGHPPARRPRRRAADHGADLDALRAEVSSVTADVAAPGAARRRARGLRPRRIRRRASKRPRAASASAPREAPRRSRPGAPRPRAASRPPARRPPSGRPAVVLTVQEAVAARRVLITGVANPLGRRSGPSAWPARPTWSASSGSTRATRPEDLGAPRAPTSRGRPARARPRPRRAAAGGRRVVHNDLLQFPEPAAPARAAARRQRHRHAPAPGRAGRRCPRLRTLVVRGVGRRSTAPSRADPAFFTEDLARRAPLRTRFQRDVGELERLVDGFARRHAAVVTARCCACSRSSGPASTRRSRASFAAPVVPTVLGFDPRVQVLARRGRHRRAGPRGPAPGRAAPVNVAAPRRRLAAAGCCAASHRPFLPVAGPVPAPRRVQRRPPARRPAAAAARGRWRYLRYGRGVDTARMVTRSSGSTRADHRAGHRRVGRDLRGGPTDAAAA